MSSRDGNNDHPKDDKNDSRPAAITYPIDNVSNLPQASQPRQPRNLQDLLRYSTEAAGAEAAGRSPSDGNSSASALDEESKKFLEEALKHMTVDVVGELLKCINTLQRANDLHENPEDSAECESALDRIFDFVDNLNVANDFHKIGGFSILKPCFNSSVSGIRWRGAELVAYLCQNNPYCQEKILETEILPIMLNMIDTDENDTVRVKALYAVSCLIRNNEKGIIDFARNDGYSVLLRALQSDVEKLIIKSAFLLSALCNERPEIKDELVKMGYVELLIGQITVHLHKENERFFESAEHLLVALLGLVQNHEKSQRICKKPELRFKEVMKCIVENSEGSDDCKEQSEYAQVLMNLVFGNNEVSAVEDR